MGRAEDSVSTSPSGALVRECPLPADQLLRALLRLEPARRVAVLDSGGARGGEARYLIAGFDPFETVEARADQLLIRRRGGALTRAEGGAPLAFLDERLARHHAPGARASGLPAAGACVATFAYDLARSFARLRTAPPPAAAPEPDATLAFYDTLCVHDYTRGTTHLVGVGGPGRIEETLAALHQALAAAGNDGDRRRPRHTSDAPRRVAASNFTRGEYLSAVRRVKEHIFAGDIYQANLTQQLTCPLAAGDTPEEVFLRLRRDHPASFAAFLRRSEDVVVSASPERFLRVGREGGGRVVEAWPIKGTRPRGASAEEDARLRRELLESQKDAAENVMIVDLARNDLGRVCRYGSVEVAALRELQAHPTLFHLVSRVRGLLRDDVTAGDLLRAAFPCGSITGAPKLRAMEIIDEVETARRGLSMGAVGYFSFDGALDLNVAIRTMTIRGGLARFNVGGGVVAESEPEREYEESLLKARALLRALGATL